MEISPQVPVRLSVSVVLHNSSLELLHSLLESLHLAAAVAREAACVDEVLVDVLDNSSDAQSRRQTAVASASWPRSSFFRIDYRELPGNDGFGAGHNRAIRSLDSQYHLVLNPDAELARDTLLVGLACLQADSSIVLLSPHVEADDASQEFLCKRYPSVLVLLLRAFAPACVNRLFRQRLASYEMRDICSAGQEADVPLASGCFMLVRTPDLQAVGGFDEAYFLYFEDFDLSLRLASKGRLVFNPAMRIVHHGGYAASKGMRHVKYFVRSGITFFNRHGWRWI